MKCKLRKSETLHKRLVNMILLVTIFSLFGCAAISYITITSTERNHMENSMKNSLSSLTQDMDQAYMSMLQISQQLIPQGTTGSKMENFLQMNNNPYESYQLKTQIRNEIVTLAFPNSKICTIAYYNTGTDDTYFSSFKLNGNFSITDVPTLVNLSPIEYQCYHDSYRMYQNGQVISLARIANFHNNPEVIIYIEALVDQLDCIQDSSSSKQTQYPYILLQADLDGKICYSSDMEEINPKDGLLVSDFLKDEKTQGTTEHYFVISQKSNMGYTNLVLMRLVDYHKETYIWLRRFALLCAISIGLFYVTTLVINRFIYHPMQLFEKEFRGLGKGSFETRIYQSGIVEFDRLFEEFNHMKCQIRDLLIDVEKQEKEKHQLEIEQLIYQINPHFLLNTLNSIHWLAKINNQPEIANFVTELNSMLAYNLGKLEKKTTFRTEVAMLLNYINIQKVRYDFDAVIEIEEGSYLDMPTVRMLLQPMVENAIRYGIGSDGMILIRMFYEMKRNYVVIMIEDHGQGLTLEKLKKLQEPFHYQNDGSCENDGIGLRYVRSMIETFYGERAFLSINSELKKGTKITLLLPLILEGDENDDKGVSN